MALWCSRLARQPVTLEVDGSSPFGVANKNRFCLMTKAVFCMMFALQQMMLAAPMMITSQMMTLR